MRAGGEATSLRLYSTYVRAQEQRVEEEKSRDNIARFDFGGHACRFPQG